MRYTATALVGLLGAASSYGQSCIWRSAHLASAPGPIVFDSTNSRVLAVGSAGSVSVWNGATWVALLSAGNPSHGGPVVFDSMRGRIVQCGGGGGASLFNDTWEWDGFTWRLITETGPWGTGSLAFDEARGVVVRFHQVTGAGPGQTWIWNGAAWTMASWAGPATGYYPMVYDSDRLKVVMLGRVSVSGREVWDWNGTGWKRGPDAPLPAGGTAMYDRRRHTIVLHVGGSGSTLSRTWEGDPETGAWVERTTGGPGAGQLVFDAGRGLGIMGVFSYSSEGSIWEWNGAGTVTPVVVAQLPIQLQLYPGETAEMTVVATTTGTPTYHWYHNSELLTNGGNVSGANTPVLRVESVTPADRGSYWAMVGNGCEEVRSPGTWLYVPGGPCYANCDGSTSLPQLTANDFMCFINAWSAGDSYANCDGSTGQPRLTVEDFQCFIDSYAGGCR